MCAFPFYKLYIHEVTWLPHNLVEIVYYSLFKGVKTKVKMNNFPKYTNLVNRDGSTNLIFSSINYKFSFILFYLFKHLWQVTVPLIVGGEYFFWTFKKLWAKGKQRKFPFLLISKY